jgi:hypothetical protein
VTSEAAQSGAFGVRLVRTGGKRNDIILAPLHRLLVLPGEPLTVLVRARGTAADAASLQLSWYNDTIGASQAHTTVPLAVGHDWASLRIDTVVPGNAVAVGLFIRLAPLDLARVQLDIDNVDLIVWHHPSPAPECGYVRFGEQAPVGDLKALAMDMPGTGDVREQPSWIQAESLPVPTQAPLPAGPANGGWGSVE